MSHESGNLLSSSKVITSVQSLNPSHCLQTVDESAFTRKVDFFMELPKGEPELIELCID